MASLTPIKPGDIIEANVKGRKGFGIVTEKLHGRLEIRPLTQGFTYRTVTAHQVEGHYRKTKNTRKLKPTGQDAD